MARCKKCGRRMNTLRAGHITLEFCGTCTGGEKAHALMKEAIVNNRPKPVEKPKFKRKFKPRQKWWKKKAKATG